MNKKKISLFGLVILSVGMLTAVPVYADETEPTPVEEVVYPAKVTTNLTKGGMVTFDVEEGNVGDIVTAYIKPDFLFSVKEILINGNTCPINEEGKYQFQLIEGENLVSVDFEVDNERLREIAELVNGVKEEGFKSLFTMDNVLNLISWAVSIILSSGFFITLIKNKKLRAKTIEQVSDLVVETIKKEDAKALEKFLDTLLPEVLDKINLKIDNVDECMKTLCRCFVLAQNDTAENRLAIINELTKLSNSDESLSEQIRSIVKEEQAAQAQIVLEREKAIKELKESNDSLASNNNNNQGDNYGQI